MKMFVVDRHTDPQNPTWVEIPTEKIPVYDDIDDLTADLANLEVNQFAFTKDTGTELSAPVDVVEEDNLHAVTSNAVYNFMIPDYANAQEVIAPSAGSSADHTYTCTENGFVSGLISVQNGAPSYTDFYINNIRLARCCGKAGVLEGVDGIGIFPVKKGDVVKVTTETNYGSSANLTKIYFIPSL